VDTKQFIASLVSSLAWPAAVVAVAFLFRKQLATLLTSGPLKRLKAGPFELELDRIAAVVEERVEAGEPGLPEPTGATGPTGPAEPTRAKGQQDQRSRESRARRSQRDASTRRRWTGLTGGGRGCGMLRVERRKGLLCVTSRSARVFGRLALSWKGSKRSRWRCTSLFHRPSIRRGVPARRGCARAPRRQARDHFGGHGRGGRRCRCAAQPRRARA